MCFDITKTDPPKELYLDTSFLITSLIQTPSEINRHKKARNFLDKIINQETVVFTSLLTEIEFIETCIYLALMPIVGKGVGVALKANPKFFETHKSKIDDFIDRYRWTREKLAGRWTDLAINQQVIKTARNCAQEYNLMFKDGIHLASARLLFCDNFVSLDKDFSSIKNLNFYTLIKKS